MFQKNYYISFIYSFYWIYKNIFLQGAPKLQEIQNDFQFLSQRCFTLHHSELRNNVEDPTLLCKVMVVHNN